MTQLGCRGVGKDFRSSQKKIIETGIPHGKQATESPNASAHWTQERASAKWRWDRHKQRRKKSWCAKNLSNLFPICNKPPHSFKVTFRVFWTNVFPQDRQRSLTEGLNQARPRIKKCWNVIKFFSLFVHLLTCASLLVCFFLFWLFFLNFLQKWSPLSMTLNYTQDSWGRHTQQQRKATQVWGKDSNRGNNNNNKKNAGFVSCFWKKKKKNPPDHCLVDGTQMEHQSFKSDCTTYTWHSKWENKI